MHAVWFHFHTRYKNVFVLKNTEASDMTIVLQSFSHVESTCISVVKAYDCIFKRPLV